MQMQGWIVVGKKRGLFHATDQDWLDWDTTVTVHGNYASAVDTSAGLEAARFYRIKILP